MYELVPKVAKCPSKGPLFWGPPEEPTPIDLRWSAAGLIRSFPYITPYLDKDTLVEVWGLGGDVVGSIHSTNAQKDRLHRPDSSRV